MSTAEEDILFATFLQGKGVFSSTTNRNLTTMTSLEIIANRYRAKAASLEPQYSVADIVKRKIVIQRSQKILGVRTSVMRQRTATFCNVGHQQQK